MAYSIEKKQIIDYPPEKLNDFFKISFEWIDNLNFALNPSDCLENSEEYIHLAKAIFTEMGWYGDGEVQLIWIPPFMFDGIRTEKFTKGIVIWHVKQEKEGISWILSPIDFCLYEKQWIIFKNDEPKMVELGKEQGAKEKKNILFIA